jgi:hypothetical protein
MAISEERSSSELNVKASESLRMVEEWLEMSMHPRHDDGVDKVETSWETEWRTGPSKEILASIRFLPPWTAYNVPETSNLAISRFRHQAEELNECSTTATLGGSWLSRM